MEKVVTERDDWRSRPVLVTGISGFVGSCLAARLVDLGAHVVGIVRDDVAHSNFRSLKLEKKVTVVRGEVEDYFLLDRTINEYAVEVVYHLAAQPIVATAQRSPLSTFQTNIQGTWNLLEACRGKRHVSAVVVASSDKAYGPHKELPYREEFPLNPEYPYEVSKACADLIARSYFKTYGLPVVVTRFANIYGPGDLNFTRIVPETILSALEGRNPVIRSDGTPERDYLYIDDATDLYILLAERIERTKGEVFNAGHRKPVKVIEVVETILRSLGREDLRPEVCGQGTLRGEIDRQWIDGEKARQILGWEPVIGLPEGIRRTVEWHRLVARSLP